MDKGIKNRKKTSRLWTGHKDKNGLLIFKGDRVKQRGCRGGCYNNPDRIITVTSTCSVCSGLFADGYHSIDNEIVGVKDG